MMAGFAAASHLDLVLSKLDYVGKMDAKRSSSFFDFFKVCMFQTKLVEFISFITYSISTMLIVYLSES